MHHGYEHSIIFLTSWIRSCEKDENYYDLLSTSTELPALLAVLSLSWQSLTRATTAMKTNSDCKDGTRARHWRRCLLIARLTHNLVGYEPLRTLVGHCLYSFMIYRYD
jgi:hypothetical protein